MNTNISPDDIPDGFTAAGPGGGGADQQAVAKKQAVEEQRRSLLEQAMTPEALARLGTLKVRRDKMRWDKVEWDVMGHSFMVIVVHLFETVLRYPKTAKIR